LFFGVAIYFIAPLNMSLNQKSRHKNILGGTHKPQPPSAHPSHHIPSDHKIKQGQTQRVGEKQLKERFFELIEFLATS
jgi:hypothetical protein